ncbi:Coenzyme F420 hydrogenase/dehydrogenase, beta subunit C-terminal domain [Clostridium fessum]|uniref:Coenzyme F420 hydrogenase/dehydrogenase, beta subunit C-terminal domain n=1 Tax=Clostridium fessum TaxID=2126740 RepID=UPI0022E3B7A0|nr:Coenzyme F420 hydrogenase/dehydrogenase, beta subunit C-terminal domain [Clostridium fessum]
MIQISDKTKCCGCTACASVCPKNCISMQCDGEGFLYPVVDADSCVNCGLCERICSQLSEHEEERTDRVKYIACQNINENVRKVSTSGGMFGLLAEQVISSGGTIWAAGFDDTAIVVHKEAREFDELNDLYGSKYVQSDLKDTFKKIRQELITSDKTVLFVGTPCQVEGLLYYLGKKEKEHLLTVDLVCYGVPSPGLYKEWIQDIAQKHGSKVSRVYFRDKKYGYAGVNIKVMLQNGQALEDIVDVKTYTKTMFSKLGLRPSCYKCVYRGRNKMSDFTIGDFWQIGDYSKQMDDDRGTSIVQINTRKGEDFLNDIGSEKIKKIHVETLENDDLKSKIYKEDYTFEIPKNRSQFFEDSGRMSYDDLIQKYLPASRKDKMATALKPIIHKMPFSHFFFRTMKKVRMNRRKRK